jgi:DNA-directed RNA polymerase subunit alpha
MHRNWQDLITPQGIEVEKLSNDYGKFTAKPLERGYGTTLGNTLRRVLLSSINGAAIVAIKIPNVGHEFSTIRGIKEDVTDIVLNLKQVSLRYLGDRPATIRLKNDGDGVLIAGDIQTSGEVEILNPEQHICTVGSGASMEIEMMVKHGRGYVSAEDNRAEEDVPADWICIDSIFSPVRRVAYSVSNARVGQMTDYDRLTMELWTNGAVRPDDAVAYAAKIVKEQLTVFINFDETEEVQTKIEETETEHPKLNDNLFKTVDSLELSVRAANCLENANIKFIGELVTRTEADMLKTKNFGRKSLNEIKDILAEMGLSLGMKIDGFDPSTLRQGDAYQGEE